MSSFSTDGVTFYAHVVERVLEVDRSHDEEDEQDTVVPAEPDVVSAASRASTLAGKYGGSIQWVTAVDPGKKGGFLTALPSSGDKEGKLIVITEREDKTRSAAGRLATVRRRIAHADPRMKQLEDRKLTLPTRKVSGLAALQDALMAKYALFLSECQALENHGRALSEARFTQRVRRQKTDAYIARVLAQGRRPPVRVQWDPRPACTFAMAKKLRKARVAKEKERSSQVIAWGSATGFATLKGHAPSRTIGVRRAVQRLTGKVEVVNEAYTTKVCHHCHQVVGMVHGDRGGYVHRLKRCTNSNCLTRGHTHPRHTDRAGIIHRDHNACRNITYLFREEMGGRPRPSCFTKSRYDEDHRCPHFAAA